MKTISFCALVLVLLAHWPLNSLAQEPVPTEAFQIHGHRGARAYLPENTLASARKALELGANWIEVDLVATARGRLILSHEPWLNPELCNFQGELVEGNGKAYNIYQMTPEQVAACTCGVRPDPDFPMQEAKPTPKIGLVEFVRDLDSFARERNISFSYNLEIKFESGKAGEYYPPTEEYARMILRDVEQLPLGGRVLIQSFSPEILNALYELNPELEYGFLTALPGGLVQLKQLDFTPAAFNPNYRLVTRRLVRKAHEQGIKVIPWTVNELTEMRDLRDMGVDGIISDYPDRVKAVE